MSEIKFTREQFTPVLAAITISAHNKDNRTLRESTVNTYSRDMQNGKWRETHQCIAFNQDGDLIDGQHRLHAVLRSGETIWFYVARYSGSQTAMHLPIDQNIKRSAADIIGCDRRTQETSTAILRLSSGAVKGVSASEIEDCIKKYSRQISRVQEVIKTNVRHRTSASARAAIVILIHSQAEHEDEIMEQYKAFASLDFDVMWSSTKALVKLFDLGSVPTGAAGGAYESQRVFYTFDPKNKNVKIIRILEPESMARSIREAAALG